MQEMAQTIVSRAEQEKSTYLYKVDFAQLKSEIRMLEKNDFAILKSENERLQVEVEKLKQKMREEVNRLQAGVRLDMNLEKGRVREEASVQDIKIRETNNRIDTEMSNLRTLMQTIKFDTIKYVVGKVSCIRRCATGFRENRFAMM
jgi:type II secretory pathway component PulF